jgi:hypothetical protein
VHEEGTWSNGRWNLSCFLQTINALGSDTFQKTGSASAAWQNSNFTYTYGALGTYNLYETGQYSNYSYSFGSYALDYKVTSNAEWTEKGGNAIFSAFSRDDTDNYSYSYSVRGSGATGTQTQSALETISLIFNGTYAAGGTVSSISIFTMGYSNSAATGISSGIVLFPGAVVAKPIADRGLALASAIKMPMADAAPTLNELVDRGQSVAWSDRVDRGNDARIVFCSLEIDGKSLKPEDIDKLDLSSYFPNLPKNSHTFVKNALKDLLNDRAGFSCTQTSVERQGLTIGAAMALSAPSPNHLKAAESSGKTDLLLQ